MIDLNFKAQAVEIQNLLETLLPDLTPNPTPTRGGYNEHINKCFVAQF